MKPISTSSPAGRNGSFDGKDGPPSIRRILFFLFVLVWLIAIPLVFYIFHKPLPPVALARIRNILVDLFGAGWILWIGAGIGWRFVRKGEVPALEKIALAEALGLGVMGLLFLGIAWTGGMYRPVAIIALLLLTVAATAILLPPILGAMKTRRLQPWGGNGFSLLLGLFLAVSLLLALGIALCPPISWDALVYHLQIPQQIVAAHSLSFPGDSLFREMPEIVEMLYTGAIEVTGRAETAAVLGWGIGLTALLGITGIARRWGLRYPLLPAALLLASDTLAHWMGAGYSDWGGALFGVAALCAVSRKREGLRWLVLAGVFAGFALGTKYTAGALLIVLILALASVREWRKYLKEAALVLAGCALAFSPWLVRGLAFWGNPLPSVLATGAADALRLRFFAGSPLTDNWLILAVAPLLQSTVGSYGVPAFGATISPLLIALLPGALVRRREDLSPDGFLIKIFWLCAIVYWAAVGLGGFFTGALTQPRVFLVLFPGIALLSARGWEGLWEIRMAKIRLGAIAAVLTVLALTVQAAGFINAWVASGGPDYLAGAASEQTYLANNLGWYAEAMQALRALPSGSHVLLLWEPRGLYCGAVCLADSTLDRWYLAMRMKGSMENALEQWHEEGWTDVLIFNSGAEFERAGRAGYSASDWKELDRLRAMLEPIQDFGGAYTLYAVPANPWREP